MSMEDELQDVDNGEQAVTTLEVCGEPLVASRHTIFTGPSSDKPGSAAKHFTRGSIVAGPVIHHDVALISCFKELNLRFVPEGDRIVFACEVRASVLERCFFCVVTSTRGQQNKEESMVLIARKQTDEDPIEVLTGIPIFSSLTIEFRGRGVFGIYIGEKAEKNALYFETKSLHSMWAAIVTLEKIRDKAKVDKLYESDNAWMLDYLPIVQNLDKPRHAAETHTSISELSVSESIIDPEEEGEGGASMPALRANQGRINHPRQQASGSFSTFISHVRIFESEQGIAQKMFSLNALKKALHRRPTQAQIGRQSYEKPDLDKLFFSIFDFVSTAQDPDELSVSDVFDYLKREFGDSVVGKYGYSSAMIDSLIYRAVGQLEPPSQILDRLYLGSEYNAANLQELKNLNISHVLNVTVEVTKFFPDVLKYHQVNILDLPTVQILPYLERAVEFIETALRDGTGCFVHCQRGVSRSASCVIAYVMKSQKMRFDEALTFVKSKRRIVKPNSGFIAQLKEWEKKVFGEE